MTACCFQNNKMTLIQEHIIYLFIWREQEQIIYICLYGEGLPLKHLPKILGKPKPRPHVRVEWYLLPWSENKHLGIS